MQRERIAPTVTQGQIGASEKHDILTHPAFAVVKLSSLQNSHKESLFGSNVGHVSYLHFEICPAELRRTLGRDWIHPSKGPILSFSMTHDQFSRLISGVGRGEGIPVTLDRASSGPTDYVPEIAEVPSKQALFRKEIRESLKSHLKGLSTQVERLDKMIESGKLSKKDLREITKELERHLHQAPGNLDFVIKSAEETLETATETAKVEVDAYVSNTARALGVQRLEELSAGLQHRASLNAPDSED